jgi:hypothetical protein
MKGPEFNAKLVLMNKKAQDKVDALVKRDDLSSVDKLVIKEVLLPFLKIVNQLELDNTAPALLMDAMTATSVAMASEYLQRTTPPQDSRLLMGNVQHVLDEYTAGLVRAVEYVFSVKIDMAQPTDHHPPATA